MGQDILVCGDRIYSRLELRGYDISVYNIS